MTFVLAKQSINKKLKIESLLRVDKRIDRVSCLISFTAVSSHMSQLPRET